MTREEIYNNYANRSTSIMVGALLDDTIASFDIILGYCKDNRDALPHIADALMNIKSAVGYMLDNLADTEPMEKAYEFADRILEKALEKLM